MRKNADSVVIRAYFNEDADVFEFESIGDPKKQLIAIQAIVTKFFKKYGVDKADKFKIKDICWEFGENLYISLGGNNETVDKNIRRPDGNLS